MSLASRPGATYPFSIPADAALPEERRPRFTAVFLTCDQWVELAEFGDDKDALLKLPLRKLIAELRQRILAHLRGWERVQDEKGEVPFVEANVRWPFTLDETWELYDSIREGSRLSVTEKNESTSPSSKATGSSAGNAGPDASPTGTGPA